MSGTNGNPLSTAGNGRTGRGTFAAGNKFGKGNPANRRAQMLRATYVRAVTREELTAIVKAMVEAAKGGDVAAAKEVCDRILGKAVSSDLLERLERVEEALTMLRSYGVK